MAATYDTALVTLKDQVRFLIQDTNVTAAKFQDEEIGWVISTEANVYMAAVALCDRLIMAGGGGLGVKYKKIGEFSISYDPHYYMMLRGTLLARGSSHQVPSVGGISIVDKDAQKQDTDRVVPAFSKGMEDNPLAPKPEQPATTPLTTY